jgi:hypothetical protein
MSIAIFLPPVIHNPRNERPAFKRGLTPVFNRRLTKAG